MSGLFSRGSLAPRGICECLRMFSVVTVGREVLLAFNEQELGCLKCSAVHKTATAQSYPNPTGARSILNLRLFGAALQVLTQARVSLAPFLSSTMPTEPKASLGFGCLLAPAAI